MERWGSAGKADTTHTLYVAKEGIYIYSIRTAHYTVPGTAALDRDICTELRSFHCMCSGNQGMVPGTLLFHVFSSVH